MKGNLHKKYEFATIITEGDLKALSTLVSAKFNFVKYEIKTKDGAEYCADNFDEILGYDNHDYRKIVLFRVKGNRNERDSFIFPNISISLYDNSTYQEACILDIKGLDDTEIVYFSQKVKDFTKQIKAPYWWCHKPAFYCIMSLALYAILTCVFLRDWLTNEEDKAYVFIILLIIGSSCGMLSVLLGRRIVSWIFPEGCFCIGEQRKYIHRKEKYRGIILGTILIPLIISIVASIIAQTLY
jgi:hypothetical protein